MHRFQRHFFDLTNLTSGTSNFDLTPIYLFWVDMIPLYPLMYNVTYKI